MNAQLVSDCQDLIRIPSLSGNEEEAARFVQKVMRSLGYDRVWIDRLGNVIGIIEGKGPHTVLLEGHLDTVDVADPGLWTTPPYSGQITNDRLYGRGASDMKGALMAMVHGAGRLVPDRSRLRGSVAVCGVVCEELFEGVAQAAVLDELNPDIVIIGEASELRLCIGQRGRAEILLTVHGKSSHSARPEAGINAVKKAAPLIEEIERISLPHNDFLGDAILELTDIISSPYPGSSVIPDRCMVTYDRRLLTGETEEAVLQPFKDIITRHELADPRFRADVSIVAAEFPVYTGEIISAKRFFPAWQFSKDDTFVMKAIQGLKKCGLESEISHYSFCTDGSQSAGVRNIPTIGFGPSRENLAHVIDEYIEIEQILKACRGYEAIVRQLME